MPLLKRILLWLSHLLVGVTFIFSGLMKGVDPWGTAYKIEDYLMAFGMDWLLGSSLVFAVLLCVVELYLGLLVLFGQLRGLSFWGVVAFMGVFTPVTLYLAIANPISDCGCFGDAVKISNWGTFFKNVVLCVALVAMYFFGWHRRVGYHNHRFRLSHGVVLLLALFPSYHALRHLPLLDFRPYSLGVNIPEAMSVPEGAPADEYATRFIYEKDGEQREFDDTDYPWDDTTWHFVSSETRLVRAGYRPAIAEFPLHDELGNDVSSEVLGEGYRLLVVSPNVDDVSGDEVSALQYLCVHFLRHRGVPGYLLTASVPLAVQGLYLEGVPEDIVAVYGDERILKTVVRAHPGVVLLYDGTVMGKWRLRDFPLDRFESGEIFSTQVSSLGGRLEQVALLAMGLAFALLLFYYLYRGFVERVWLRIERGGRSGKRGGEGE